MSKHPEGAVSTYQYRTLHAGDIYSGEPKIRVIFLHPSSDYFADLKCHIEHVRLPESYPENATSADDNTMIAPCLADGQSHCALSYTWGEPVFSKTLFCEQGFIKITENLDLALRRLRHHADVHALWVDAVCINQADIAERTAQVRLMWRIYSQAQKVHAWLGLDSEANDGKLCFELLDKLVELSKAYNEMVLRGERLKAFAKGYPAQIKELIKELASLQPRSPLELFFTRPYFTRRWILQELYFARNVVLHCGDLSNPWHDLYKQLRADLARGVSGLCDQTSVETMSYALMLRMGPHTNVNTPLDLLLETSMLECADDRDRVLSLLNVINAISARTKSEDLIVWDLTPHFDSISYCSSIPEVYTAFARAYLTCALRKPASVSQPWGAGRMYEMHLLYVAGSVHCQQHAVIASDMPSWVPDWRHQYRYKPANNWDPCFWGSVYACIGLTEMPLELDQSADILYGWGVLFDVVKETIPFTGNFVRELDRAYRCCVEDGPPEERICSHTGEDTAYAIAVTLIADREHCEFMTFKRCKNCKIPVKSEYILNPKLLEPDSEDGEALVYRNVLFRTMRGRCFFTTKRGYIRIAPDDTHANDMVTVLSRARTPFILRQADSTSTLLEDGYVRTTADSRFRLVGDAYVHGIMNGEAVEQLRPHLDHAFRRLSIV